MSISDMSCGSNQGADSMLVKAKHAARERMAKTLLAEWKDDEDCDQLWVADKMDDLQQFVLEYKSEIDELLKKEKAINKKGGKKRDLVAEEKDEEVLEDADDVVGPYGKAPKN